jgi:hypothetical protein
MKRIYLVFALMTIIGSGSVRADERSTGFVGSDCFGQVNCNNGKVVKCLTNIQSPTHRSQCIRHFGSDEGFVLCETFDNADHVVESERLDCTSTPPPSGRGAAH